MYAGRSILAVIAARGGSKGLPRKNVLPLAGRPLVAWSVLAAARSTLLDHTILSSDDAEIIAAARDAGCDVPFMRPSELATDEASIEEVVISAMEALDRPYDYVVLLQATSPLRQAEDIDGAIRACIDAAADSAVAVTPAPKSPYNCFHLGEDAALSPLFDEFWQRGRRRQLLPPTFTPNGAVYVARAESLKRTRSFYQPSGLVGYIMPAERSVDIDTELDFRVAEALAAKYLTE